MIFFCTYIFSSCGARFWGVIFFRLLTSLSINKCETVTKNARNGAGRLDTSKFLLHKVHNDEYDDDDDSNEKNLISL